MKIKSILPLLATVSLMAGPVLLLTACDNTRDMNNLPPGKLPPGLDNRILFDFLGVNFSKTVSQQFKDTYNSTGIDIILKDVEGIIAKQKFYDFFNGKLGFSADSGKTEGQANLMFDNLKDQLGLNLLTQAYMNGLNSRKDSLEVKNYLLFQNDSWHQNGTTKFNYNYKDSFYTGDHDPNALFNNNLYTSTDPNIDKKIEETAKHADTDFSNDIANLTNNHDDKNWNGDAGTGMKQPPFNKADGIQVYQKNLKRFQWWLRFRYQQYYEYEILPNLNQTLFTMSYILDHIFDVKKGTKPTINVQNNLYISQLQDLSSSFSSTNFRETWAYKATTTTARADNDSLNNATSPATWSSLISGNGSSSKYNLNPDFFEHLMTNLDPSNSVDNSFGINSFVGKPTGGYATKATSAVQEGWLANPAGQNYFTINTKFANLAYTAPMYFLDIIQNLDFNPNDILPPTPNPTTEPWTPNGDLINNWNSADNPANKQPLSLFLRGGNASDITQNQKWNIFWQMLYSLSDQTDSANTNAKSNFDVTSHSLFPLYIPKNNIYEETFWNAVKGFYPT